MPRGSEVFEGMAWMIGMPPRLLRGQNNGLVALDPGRQVNAGGIEATVLEVLARAVDETGGGIVEPVQARAVLVPGP